MKLQQLQKTARRFTPVAAFVLIPALALAALASCAGEKKPAEPEAVMVINGERVTAKQIDEAVEVLRSPEMMTSPDLLLGGGADLRRAAARGMAGNLLMLAEVRARGWEADTAVVNIMAARFISRFPSREDFDEQLAAFGESEASMRKGMAEQILLDSLMRVISAAVPPADSAEVRAHYEANKDRYVAPGRVRASQIVFALQPDASDSLVRETMLRANEARAKAAAGGDFEKLAAEYSSLPKDTDMGWFSLGELLPELERTLFAMKTGDVSAPVPSGLGIHIFKKTGEGGPRPMQFDEIAMSLNMRRQGDAARAYIDSLIFAADMEFADTTLDFRAAMRSMVAAKTAPMPLAGDTAGIR